MKTLIIVKGVIAKKNSGQIRSQSWGAMAEWFAHHIMMGVALASVRHVYPMLAFFVCSDIKFFISMQIFLSWFVMYGLEFL